MECINKTIQEWLDRCWECEHFDPVTTAIWRSCTHPDRYGIDESLVSSIDCLDDSIKPYDLSTFESLPISCIEDCSVKADCLVDFKPVSSAEVFPFYYIDNGCPLEVAL